MLGVGCNISAPQQNGFTPISGGGDVPSGATAHFSLAQGTAWTQADGPLTLADIMSSTTSVVDGVGYTGEDNVTLIGPALAALSPNMTIVLRGRIIVADSGDDSSANVVLVDFADTEDFNNAASFGIGVSYVHGTPALALWQSIDAYDTENEVQLNGTHMPIGAETETRFDMATTIKPTGLSSSILGGDTETQPGDLSIPASAGIADLTNKTFGLDVVNLQLALESITIYPPQDDADLPALSTPL